MDLSDEICLKIKSAIKARLKELGIVWDRELPDYVMVLIKNKKTKEQMEIDLNIFLGPHTTGFTEWLYDVCQKLEACTVTSKGVKKKEEDRKPRGKQQGADDQDDWEDDLSHDSDNENYSSTYSQTGIGRSPLLRDENGFRAHSENSDGGEKRPQSSNQNTSREEQRKPRERIQINWNDDEPSREIYWRRRALSRSQQSRPRRSRSKSRHRSRSTSRLKDEGSRRKERGGSKYRERSGSRERRMRDAREFIRSRSSQERSRNGFGRRKGEKERSNKSQNKDKNEEKLPSLVKITPRPVRPLSMQPPPNLILKAVADAHKSIAITSLPQPEDKLGHDDKPISKPVRKKPAIKKKIRPGFEPNLSVTLLNDRVSASKPETPPENEYSYSENMEESRLSHQRVPEVPRFTISLQSDDDSIIGSDYEENDQNAVFYDQTPIIENTVLQPEPEPMDISGVEIVEEKETSEPPVYRFDRSRLGPKVMPVVPDTETVLECLAPNSNITKTIMNENAFSEGSETRSDENDKLIKCKFWPSCEAGDSCRFYHPKTYCRSRNCKFGQKCLFIHPPCKFGDKCLNVACPYTHNTTSSGPAPAVPGKAWTKVPLAPSNGQICMFFPNCTKPFCPYQHYEATGSGIPCKYGSMCTKLMCEFDHPQSSKNPYKWVAPNSE